jgi:hypothetical protein
LAALLTFSKASQPASHFIFVYIEPLATEKEKKKEKKERKREQLC